MSLPNDEPVKNDKAETPVPAAKTPETPVPPADPPADPPAEPPHVDKSDRLDGLETILTNLTETVNGLVTGLAKAGDAEQTPTKKPWTHWGTKS